jgi:hypothetical protein
LTLSKSNIMYYIFVFRVYLFNTVLINFIFVIEKILKNKDMIKEANERFNVNIRLSKSNRTFKSTSRQRAVIYERLCS